MQICRPDEVRFLESEEEKDHQDTSENGTPPVDPLPTLTSDHVASADRAYEGSKGQAKNVTGKFGATFMSVVRVRYLKRYQHRANSIIFMLKMLTETGTRASKGAAPIPSRT